MSIVVIIHLFDGKWPGETTAQITNYSRNMVAVQNEATYSHFCFFQAHMIPCQHTPVLITAGKKLMTLFSISRAN